MRHSIIISSIIAAFILLSPVDISGQENEDQYPVTPVYTPEMERPDIQVERSRLPVGYTGRLPAYDGELFRLNLLPDKESRAGEEDARSILNQFLQAINWQFKMEHMLLLSVEDKPLSDKGKLDSLIKEESENTRKELEGRFGKGKLSEDCEEVIQEQGALARKQASDMVSVIEFQQMFPLSEGITIPIEATELRLRYQNGYGYTALTGRVFNEIKVENRNIVSPEEARKAAFEYFKVYTTISESGVGEPELILLPYGMYFRITWRMDVNAIEGMYRVWIDAESSQVLQLIPQFYSTDATGLVFNPNPDEGTREISFEVDPASGGVYRLLLTGVLEVNNAGADGVCSGDLTLTDDGSGVANFNVSPINGIVVDRIGSTGYNCRFQDVNAFGWIHRHITTFTDLLGSASIPALTVTVNDNNACIYGPNNACASPSGNYLEFGIGQATLGTSTSSSDFFNSAIDATVITHEFGHIINHHNFGGSLTRNINEGLADFWACTMFNTDTFGEYWASNNTVPSEGGGVPRVVDNQDVFPEHRSLSTSAYGDGQIINWALWNVRREFNEMSALGTYLINSYLIDAMSTADGVGVSSDKQVHDTFLDLLEQLAPLFSTSPNIHKVLTGYAMAGIFLSEKDAIIDINDDYLNRNDASGPTFTVWTGRDYTFSGGNAVTTSPPYNTNFVIEMSNDASFSSSQSSGNISGVTSGAGGSATWTMTIADWNALKGGDRIYYRVTTSNSTGGDIRTSEDPGNGFLTLVPPAYAIVNESGDCEISCGASAATTRGASLILLVPLLIGLVWHFRIRKKS